MTIDVPVWIEIFQIVFQFKFHSFIFIYFIHYFSLKMYLYLHYLIFTEQVSIIKQTTVYSCSQHIQLFWNSKPLNRNAWVFLIRMPKICRNTSNGNKQQKKKRYAIVLNVSLCHHNILLEVRIHTMSKTFRLRQFCDTSWSTQHSCQWRGRRLHREQKTIAASPAHNK